MGFRRGTGLSPSSGKPYRFVPDLEYAHPILTYGKQLQTLVEHGFAVWDVVQSCVRTGSLDQNIQNEHPNPIYEFCQQFPTITTIVLSNGGSGSELFVRHFAVWLRSGQFVVHSHPLSQKAFRPAVDANKKRQDTQKDRPTAPWSSSQQITIVAALAVSPAAAKLTYAQKRDFWKEHVYQPGLEKLQNYQEWSKE